MTNAIYVQINELSEKSEILILLLSIKYDNKILNLVFIFKISVLSTLIILFINAFLLNRSPIALLTIRLCVCKAFRDSSNTATLVSHVLTLVSNVLILDC